MINVTLECCVQPVQAACCCFELLVCYKVAFLLTTCVKIAASKVSFAVAEPSATASQLVPT